MRFDELGIDRRIVEILNINRLTAPTEIQSQTYKMAANGLDIIGVSKTGSGKTLAFLLPALSQVLLSDKPFHTLIITPTRELALQISDCISLFELLGVRHAALVGGEVFSSQVPALNRHPHIVVGTPLSAKPKARGVSCTKKYVHLIRDGQKRVEGRINDPKYRTIEAGSLMRLFYRSNARDDVVCVVKSVHAYKTFEEMLVAEGISNCLPGETSLENAVKIYRSFPGFSIKEKSLGVLTFRIEVHNEEHGVQCGSSEM